jgi:hypothetical protein
VRCQLVGELALQRQHRDVHRERRLEGALHVGFRPAQARGDEPRDDGGVHRVPQTVLDQRMAFLAQDLEDRQVGIACDQCLQRGAGFFQCAAEALGPRLQQHIVDTCHAVAPQGGKRQPRGMSDV